MLLDVPEYSFVCLHGLMRIDDKRDALPKLIRLAQEDRIPVSAPLLMVMYDFAFDGEESKPRKWKACAGTSATHVRDPLHLNRWKNASVLRYVLSGPTEMDDAPLIWEIARQYLAEQGLRDAGEMFMRSAGGPSAREELWFPLAEGARDLSSPPTKENQGTP